MYPGVGGVLLLPLFRWQCMCVVSAREKEGRLKGLFLLFYEIGLYIAGEIEGLVPIILRDRPVHWVSLRPCTAYSAGAGLICYPTRDPALKPGSSGLSQI